MPQARSASAAPRTGRTGSAAPRTGRTGSSAARTGRTRSRPRQAAQRAPALRVRWDRVGRIGLLVVLTVVVGLYVQHALSYFSTRAEADRRAAIVQQLTRENAALTKRQRSLNDPATIARDARVLGMVQAAERPYVVTGLPKH